MPTGGVVLVTAGKSSSVGQKVSAAAIFRIERPSDVPDEFRLREWLRQSPDGVGDGGSPIPPNDRMCRPPEMAGELRVREWLRQSPDGDGGSAPRSEVGAGGCQDGELRDRVGVWGVDCLVCCESEDGDVICVCCCCFGPCDSS